MIGLAAVHSISAIWPENDASLHRRRIEEHFEVRLTAGESSFYNSPVWRWRPPLRRRWWQRLSPAPDGLAEIRLFDNLDPQDGQPWHEGHSPSAWIVNVSAEGAGALDHARALLSQHGILVG